MIETMMAVVTLANGGYDKLVYKEVAAPVIGPGEVLVKVLAAGVNNTEINTRLGWYSSSVSSSTNASSDQNLVLEQTDGGWNGETPFPFIQGTDCCGEVVQAFEQDDQKLLGQRVLVRPCIRQTDFNSIDSFWMGSDIDGAFAQYLKIRATEVFPVRCQWSAPELATIPCAYGTSENMLHRADLVRGETVLISGASGGVGSATIQLAKRRGAQVIAISSAAKRAALLDLGADAVFDRSDNLIKELGEESIDLVVDNVAGQGFPVLLKLLRRGGRFVSSGAIAGPVVDLDLRDMYLKDLRLIGTTTWDKPIFPNLIRYIESSEIRPLLAKTFALNEIVDAQKQFLLKEHIGKFVLIP